MSLHNINRRLDQLDARHPAETPRRVIRLIVGEEEETADAAIDRWLANHPDDAPLNRETDFIILRSIVSPHVKRD
jgi:hypothetical protein